MPKPWTDAEFEVITSPLRIGDPHPCKRRWRYVGLDGAGRPLWYRPPRLNRFQFFLALCAVSLALCFVIAAIDLHRH